MTLRLPLLAEAEALAALLEARGYPATEAAANYRIAFGRGPDDVDGCLMFEGPSITQAEAVAKEWGALTEEEEDTALSSWLNAVTFSALLTLAAKAGEPEALTTRADDLAYCARVWPTC